MIFCSTVKRRKREGEREGEGGYGTEEEEERGNKCASICNESFRNESRFHRI